METEIYESHKRVKRLAMTRLEYNMYRGWELPEDEDGADEGYLVEYLDGGKPNDPRHVGYISWSPKAQFDNGYTVATNSGLSFGQAIEAMKKGSKVSREGWNAGGMHVFLDQRGYYHNPYFTLLNARGEWQPGWLATQSDMLAEDWYVV